MSTIVRKAQNWPTSSFRVIIMLSAWGFALVSTSLLFMWLGHLLDELLGTGPNLMLGMFVLAIIGCFIAIYQEALHVINQTEMRRKL